MIELLSGMYCALGLIHSTVRNHRKNYSLPGKQDNHEIKIQCVTQLDSRKLKLKINIIVVQKFFLIRYRQQTKFHLILLQTCVRLYL